MPKPIASSSAQEVAEPYRLVVAADGTSDARRGTGMSALTTTSLAMGMVSMHCGVVPASWPMGADGSSPLVTSKLGWLLVSAGLTANSSHSVCSRHTTAVAAVDTIAGMSFKAKPPALPSNRPLLAAVAASDAVAMLLRTYATTVLPSQAAMAPTDRSWTDGAPARENTTPAPPACDATTETRGQHGASGGVVSHGIPPPVAAGVATHAPVPSTVNAASEEKDTATLNGVVEDGWPTGSATAPHHVFDVRTSSTWSKA